MTDDHHERTPRWERPEETLTRAEVEVEWEVYDDRFVFMLPDTLEAARSAYAYDPVFNAAVDIYCDRKRMRPEQCLRENLAHLLHVEKRLLGATDEFVPNAMTPNLNKTEPTVRELKRMFVNDELSIEEFERRVEERLEDAE